MEIELRFIGKIISIIRIKTNGTTIEEDISNSDGKIDDKFISSLREIADLLEEKNNPHLPTN